MPCAYHNNPDGVWIVVSRPQCFFATSWDSDGLQLQMGRRVRIRVARQRTARNHACLRPATAADIHDAEIEGAIHRLRPRLMTVFAILASLVLILCKSEVGSNVTKPLARSHRHGMVSRRRSAGSHVVMFRAQSQADGRIRTRGSTRSQRRLRRAKIAN